MIKLKSLIEWTPTKTKVIGRCSNKTCKRGAAYKCTGCGKAYCSHHAKVTSSYDDPEGKCICTKCRK